MRSVGSWRYVACAFLIGCGGGGGGNSPPPPPADWQRSAQNPLLLPAIAPAPATTYEVSIADPCVRYDDATGIWHAWYSATIFDTQIQNDPGRIVIKHATSTDGQQWTVQTTPVLSSRIAAADWDYTHVETPTVVRNPDPLAPADRRWLMFYAGGNREADAAAGRPPLSVFPYYQIGLAYSADGTSFVRAAGIGGNAGLVLTAAMLLQPTFAGFGDGVCADPEAIVRDGRIELWCSSFAESVQGGVRSPLAFGVSLAHSQNGVDWMLPTANPLASLYRPGEPAGGQQPAVVHDPQRGRYEMWFKNDSDAATAALPTTFFTAAGFWRAVSADGIVWQPDYTAHDFPWRSELDYERYGLLTGCALVRRGEIDLLYYSAWGDRGIPDPARYRVPLQNGTTVPAVIGFAVAARAAR